MRRKVLRVGASSLAVSLPSKWVKEHEIKAGMEIDVREDWGNLVVQSSDSDRRDSCTIDLKNCSLSFMRGVISNAYKRGYDEVVLHLADQDLMTSVEKIVADLIGFEIVEQNGSIVTIRNIARELESECDSFLRKSFQLVFTMSQILRQSLSTGVYDQQSSINQFKATITKYTNFVKRVVNKLRRTQRAMVFEYLLVWSLEKATNEYVYAYRRMAAVRECDASSAVKKLAEIAEKQLRLMYEGYFEKNYEKIEAVATIKDDLLYGSLDTAFSSCHPEEVPAAHHLANIIRRVYDMTGPYFGIYL
jgi:phosphate uptake regulator